jgi:hypothetical protein
VISLLSIPASHLNKLQGLHRLFLPYNLQIGLNKETNASEQPDKGTPLLLWCFFILFSFNKVFLINTSLPSGRDAFLFSHYFFPFFSIRFCYCSAISVSVLFSFQVKQELGAF